MKCSTREQYGLECTAMEQWGRVIDIVVFSSFEEFQQPIRPSTPTRNPIIQITETVSPRDRKTLDEPTSPLGGFRLSMES